MRTQYPIKLQSVLSAIQAEVLTDHVPEEITGCCISDLLSDVLARAEPGVLWLTVQVHRNVVSVAGMKDIAAVLITSGRKPDSTIIAEADDAGIALLATPLSTFEAAGRLWEAGVR
ncbi:MAG TPA: DRTGG domain-containing protein [Verrucomicrobiae bacterium]|nr:DRTGG domain-containing protein [Verrucomicrobiae bacterium]